MLREFPYGLLQGNMDDIRKWLGENKLRSVGRRPLDFAKPSDNVPVRPFVLEN